MRPWTMLETIETPEGRLELRQRGDRDFLITIGGRVLMTSAAHRSETVLAQVACAPIKDRPRPQVLVGGLGMGFTLRAALDELPRRALVTVVDLNRAVVAWCKGPLAGLTGNALTDRRVQVKVADVARVIADSPGGFDVIILDLYEGPHGALNGSNDPLYGKAALLRTAAALRPGGQLAIWSEEADQAFETRLTAAGFSTTRHSGGRGGRSHVIYLSALGGEQRTPRKGDGDGTGDTKRRGPPNRKGVPGKRARR